MNEQTGHTIEMRRTGKTFRTLLSAMVAASEGHKVMYVCPTQRLAAWTRDKAIRLTAEFMEVKVDRYRLLIGEGFVEFCRPPHPIDRRALEKSKSYIIFEDY